jgi:hypothetical protein
VIFRTRARVEVNDVARRRIYRSLCGEYRVTESEPHYKDLSTIWYAEHCNTVKCFNSDGSYSGEIEFAPDGGGNTFAAWRQEHAEDFFARGGHAEIWENDLRPDDETYHTMAQLDFALRPTPKGK